MKQLFQLAVGVNEIQVSYPKEGNGSITFINYKKNKSVTVDINFELADRKQDEYWNDLVEYVQHYFSNPNNHQLNCKLALNNANT
ncbi:hypothetical protein SAMN05443144_11739 [Fodinibius roseus]|uniref:Uncharacterized protein n=2 Tax=Fodinibius roseus TaxID=1194090 RepID=A0A1M5GFU3_9BACT|nr:hypothetical protein SAMN05443144_11739 [Fodinibius roseus]